MKEEGQLLIHTAQSWGEKTMTNTSVDGREMIRHELQQLQQEWDAMTGRQYAHNRTEFRHVMSSFKQSLLCKFIYFEHQISEKPIPFSYVFV